MLFIYDTLLLFAFYYHCNPHDYFYFYKITLDTRAHLCSAPISTSPDDSRVLSWQLMTLLSYGSFDHSAGVMALYSIYTWARQTPWV